jgi:hypothetical protein
LNEEKHAAVSKPAEVNHSARQRFIQRRICGTKSGDVFAVAERGCEREAQRYPDVFCRRA